MGELLPQSWRCDSKQRGSSITGAVAVSPLSPSRQPLTSANSSPSTKKPTHRTNDRFLENIAHRTKYTQVSVVDDADVGRSSSPRQHRPIVHGHNSGLRCKAFFSSGATSGHYSLGALQGSKPPMSACSTTGSVILPQRASKFSHLNHLSVTKTPDLVPNTLLASKSFKDLQPIVTDLPRITAEENDTDPHRHKQKRGSISHGSAIPIPFGDLLLRSPRPEASTEGRGLCGKVDGPVLEGLIGVQGKDIEPLCPWDDADSQVDADVDDKNIPPTVPEVTTSTVLEPVQESVLESSERGFTEIKLIIGKAHNDDNSANVDSNDNDSTSSLEGSSNPERNGYEHRGSQTTNQALSDTPESETSQSNGGGSFGTPGYGGTPSFGYLAPSRTGNNPQKRDHNQLAVGSSKDSRTKRFSPLPLTCWYAARGYPCCNGKRHGSPEVRRLLSDHFRSKKSPNHHLLFAECPLCERLFIDKSSWEEHKKLLKSDSPCRGLSAIALNEENYGPNQRGISPARMEKVDEAVEQYKKGRSYSGCTKGHHDAWINANFKLYIGRSSVAEAIARIELGKWLVAWYAMFPDEEIPSNPFTKNNFGSLLHQGFLDRVYRDLAKQSQDGSLPPLNPMHCNIIAEIYGSALRDSELLQIDAAQSPKVKRLKIGASEATKMQPEYSLDPTLLLPRTLDDFGEDSTACDGSSFDDTCIDPKLLDNDGQADEGRPEADLRDFTHLGSRFDSQMYPKDGVTNSSSPGLRELLAPIHQFNQSQ